MSQHIPNAGYLRPRNFRMARLQLGIEMTARFGDDLKSAYHEPLFLPVSLEAIERHVAHDGSSPFNGFNDIGQARNRCPIRHQNTNTADSSIPFRSTGCRLARVMMSAGRPRIARAGAFTSINS